MCSLLWQQLPLGQGTCQAGSRRVWGGTLEFKVCAPHQEGEETSGRKDGRWNIPETKQDLGPAQAAPTSAIY